MTRSVALGLICLLSFAVDPVTAQSLQAQTARYIDSTNGLSLADAVSEALAREPSVRAARAAVDTARATRMQAAFRPNPMSSLEIRGEPGGTDSQTALQMQWPLDLFRRDARIGIADREVEIAEQSVAERRRRIASEARLRYGRAAAAVRDVDVADRLLALQTSLLDLMRRHVQEGASPPIERDRVEVQLRRLEADRALTAARADAAMVALGQAIGRANSVGLHLRDSIETVAPGPLLTQGDGATVRASEAGIRSRPDVAEAEARVRLADAHVIQARQEGRFDMSLFGSFMRMDQGFAQRGYSESGSLERVRGTFHYVSAGAMFTLPLLNRNQGGVAAATAQRIEAQVTLEATRIAANAEVASAVASEDHARRAVASMSAAVRLSRQNLYVITETFHLGGISLTDVLAEQREYLETERAYTETLLAAFEARTMLQRAIGEQ